VQWQGNCESFLCSSKHSIFKTTWRISTKCGTCCLSTNVSFYSYWYSTLTAVRQVQRAWRKVSEAPGAHLSWHQIQSSCRSEFRFLTSLAFSLLSSRILPCWQQTTGQLARQKEGQIVHWPHRSLGLFRDAVEGYWQACRRKCSDRLYGSSRLQKLRKTTKPWRDISEEIRNKDHQTHFRIKLPEANDMSEGDWGKPRETSCKTTGFWEFEAQNSCGYYWYFLC